MCSRHVDDVSRMAIQSIFTGTQGSGPPTTARAHTHHTQTYTHTHAIQHHYVDFTFVRQGFWFVVSKCRHAFNLTASGLSVCLHMDLGFLPSFLSPHNGSAKSIYHRSRAGRNQTLRMSRAGWGMFLSAPSLLLSPDRA